MLFICLIFFVVYNIKLVCYNFKVFFFGFESFRINCYFLIFLSIKMKIEFFFFGKDELFWFDRG